MTNFLRVKMGKNDTFLEGVNALSHFSIGRER